MTESLLYESRLCWANIPGTVAGVVHNFGFTVWLPVNLCCLLEVFMHRWKLCSFTETTQVFGFLRIVKCNIGIVKFFQKFLKFHPLGLTCVDCLVWLFAR